MFVGSPFRRNAAVVVGIDCYENGIPPLHSARADAAAVAATLECDHGYDVLRLLDREATYDRLHDLLLRELPATIEAEDRLIFYYAGHGLATTADDGPNGYLIPQDAAILDASRYLRMSQVHDALSRLECRHMLIVLDCCFAGAFRWSGTRQMPYLPKQIHQERYDRFVDSPAWQVIVSACHDEEASDVAVLRSSAAYRDGVTESGHSAFTDAFLRGIAGEADQFPRGGDGLITAHELYAFIEDEVQPRSREDGQRQTPRLWPLRKHEKGEFVFAVPRREMVLPPAPPLDTSNNPYRGLSSYDREDSDLFFGRAEVVKKLLARVQARPFTVVLGASGTGKSSVVKAGLLPQLASAPQSFVLPVLRPGSRAFSALTTAMTPVFGDEASLAKDPEGLSNLVQKWLAANPSRRLVITIDQLEEAITATRSADERAALLESLALLCGSDFKGRCRVVATLRSDFEALFADSPLRELWKNARFLVPPMTHAELREAIEEPAFRRVLDFESRDLVDQIIGEVLQMPGSLPLLSFTLSEMYLRYIESDSGDRVLKSEVYKSLGGAVGALQQRAKSTYDSLDVGEQETMRRILLRMVAIESGARVRRRVSQSELNPSGSDAAEAARIQKVIDALVDSRLVVLGRDDAGMPFVEPAHDTLVTVWPPLLDWLAEEQAQTPDFNTQRRMTMAAADWDAASPGEKSDYLWSDSVRAQMLKRVLATRAAQFNAVERAFATASIHRHRRTRQLVGGSIAIVMAVLASAAVIAFYQRNQALASADTALSRVLASAAQREATYDAALQLAATALRYDDNSESQDALLTSLFARRPRVLRFLDCPVLAVSGDGMLAAVRCLADGPIGIIDTETFHYDELPSKQREEESPEWKALQIDFSNSASAFDHHRKILASIQPQTGDVEIWDVEGKRSVRSLGTRCGIFQQGCNLAFSPDDRTLAISRFSMVTLWDTASWTPQKEAKGPVPDGKPHFAGQLAFSADGHVLAYSVDYDQTGSIYFWDIIQDRPLPTLQVGTQVTTLALSPDTRRIAIGDSDRHLRIVNLVTRSRVVAETGGAVTSIVYSPEGDSLATTDSSGTLTVWNANSLQQEARTETLNLSERALSFQMDRNRLVTGRLLLRTWKVRPELPTTMIVAPGTRSFEITSGRVAAVVRSSLIAVGETDGSIRLWDWTQNIQRGKSLRGNREEIKQVVISDDARYLGSASADSIWVWDLRDPNAAGRLLWQTANRKGNVSIAFGPDSQSLSATTADDDFHTWRLPNGGASVTRHIPSFGPIPSGFRKVSEISPDGRWVVLSDGWNARSLWDTTTGSIRTLETQPSSQVGQTPPISKSFLNYSADGESAIFKTPKTIEMFFLASGESNSIQLVDAAKVTAAAVNRRHDRLIVYANPFLRVWNLQSRLQIGPDIELRAEDAQQLFFVEDKVLLGMRDGSVDALDLSSASLTMRACDAARTNLSEESWRRLVPDREYECTCPNLPGPDGKPCKAPKSFFESTLGQVVGTGVRYGVVRAIMTFVTETAPNLLLRLL